MKPAINWILVFIIATTLLSGCSQSVDDQLLKAERFLNEGHLTKAKRIYDALGQQEPERPYLLYGDAMIDEYYGFNWEAMVKQLEVAKMDSGYYPAMKAFTRVALRLGYVGKAEKMALLMIQRQPQNPESYLYYGRVELAQDRFDPARTNINTAAKMTEDQTLISLFKAEVGLHTGGERARNAAFALFQELKLSSPEHFRFMASIFNYLNMNDSARYYIQKAIVTDRTNQKLKLDLAQYYYDDGLWYEAMGVIDEITAQSEFFGPAFELGAYILMAQGHVIKAEEMHNRFAILQKDSPIGMEKLADMHKNFGSKVIPSANYQAAYIKATNLLYPDDYLKQVYDKMMDALFIEGDYAMAIDYYRDGQERFSDDSLAYFWASELSHRFPEDTGSAKYNPEPLIEEKWRDQIWLEKVGQMYARTKRQDLALRIYGHLVTHPRPKLDYFTSLLDILGRQKDSTKIAGLVSVVPFRFQNNVRLIEKFMTAYRSTGQKAKELEQAQRLYAIAPGNIKTIQALARLVAARNKKMARNLFVRFSADYPEVPEGYYQLAKFDFENGLLTDSVLAGADKVLKLNERHGSALELKGRVFQAAGEADSMIEYYNRAIKSGWPVPEAYLNLAQYHLEEGKDLNLAAGLAMGAVRFFDTDPRGYQLLGQIYFAQEKYKLARTQFFKGTTLDASQGGLFYYLGKTEFKLGNKAEAKKALRRALDLGLEDSQASDAKKRLTQI